MGNEESAPRRVSRRDRDRLQAPALASRSSRSPSPGLVIRREISAQSSDGPYVFATDEVKRALSQHLRRLTPSGNTAFYDATFAGVERMLLLRFILEAASRGKLAHKFIQIILTDGEDNRSTHSFEETCKLMTQLRDLGAECKTILIGVGVSRTVSDRLRRLAALAGDNAEFHLASDSEIGKIFNRIELSLGVRRQAVVVGGREGALVMARQSAHVQVGVNFYAISFSLDISGSMQGSKWRQVCESMSRFMDNNLTHRDLVSCATFNEEVRFITGC